MPNINLLPWREEKREEDKREFHIVVIGAVCVTLLLIYLVHMSIGGRVDKQNQTNAYLRQQMVVLDQQLGAINKLKEKKNMLFVKMQLVGSLQSTRPLTVHVFDEIPRILPDGVHLNTLDRKGVDLTMTGEAESNTRVSQLMRNIDKSQWLENPVLVEIKTDDEDGIRVRDFKLEMTQTKAAKEQEEATRGPQH